jgi:hypothetical protein
MDEDQIGLRPTKKQRPRGESAASQVGGAIGPSTTLGGATGFGQMSGVSAPPVGLGGSGYGGSTGGAGKSRSWSFSKRLRSASGELNDGNQGRERVCDCAQTDQLNSITVHLQTSTTMSFLHSSVPF